MRHARCLLPALCVAVFLTASACGDDDPGGAGAERPTQPRRPPTTGAPTGGSTSDGAGTTTTATTDVDGSGDLSSVSVELTEVATGLDSPVAFAARSDDDALYVAEQPGRVRAIRDGEVDDQAVLDVSGDLTAGGEQGLLGICFSPDGALLYIDFTDHDGNTRVQEFEMRDDGTADEASRRELLFVEQPYGNHNGGHVMFGPDGMLYVGLGDGGSAGDPEGNGQDLGALLGKILRIDPRASGDDPYSVPADNPFLDDDGARPEIWMYGLRNPWRFSWDRATHDLWIGDVGQNEWEEIDFTPAGQSGVNFGWNAREGAHDYAGSAPEVVVGPIYEYSHAEGGVSVTGGFVYRGSAIPDLVGAYLFADYAQGDIVALSQMDGALAEERDLGVNAGQVSTFGEDTAGELYVVDVNGRVLRIDAA